MSSGKLTRRIRVREVWEAEEARRASKKLALDAGFGRLVSEEVALATMELAQNLVRYAAGGSIILSGVDRPGRVGIQVESKDRGPGIGDINRALEDGYSTGAGLGSGLPAVRRLMDDFEINSAPGGTTIVARKWRSTGRS